MNDIYAESIEYSKPPSPTRNKRHRGKHKGGLSLCDQLTLCVLNTVANGFLLAGGVLATIALCGNRWWVGRVVPHVAFQCNFQRGASQLLLREVPEDLKQQLVVGCHTFDRMSLKSGYAFNLGLPYATWHNSTITVKSAACMLGAGTGLVWLLILLSFLAFSCGGFSCKDLQATFSKLLICSFTFIVLIIAVIAYVAERSLWNPEKQLNDVRFICNQITSSQVEPFCEYTTTKGYSDYRSVNNFMFEISNYADTRVGYHFFVFLIAVGGIFVYLVMSICQQRCCKTT